MAIPTYTRFDLAITRYIQELKHFGEDVDTGHWQGVPTEGKPDLVTKELLNVAFNVAVPETPDLLAADIGPNLPWADNHFRERVGRVPSNPGEEYKNWPWWRGQDDVTMSVDSHDGKHFTHTYQERFWPKQARETGKGILGIRYYYGDLDDVVGLLLREPHTRQAYLPIFFPEDTGAVHGGRIPCTLGYHFLLRRGRLHMWYDIRSCDAVRHFRDDLYLAGRLLLWVIEELKGNYEEFRQATDPPPWGQGKPSFREEWEHVVPGMLSFHAHSFHVHKGDLHLL